MPKKFFALFLATIMSFSLCGIFGTTALAAETEPPADDPVIIEEYTRNVYSDIWTTVYTGTGVAKRVWVDNETPFWLDIKMVDSNGNQLWYQYHSIDAYAIGNYYVGSDVAKVLVRCADGYGSGTVNITTGNP